MSLIEERKQALLGAPVKAQNGKPGDASASDQEIKFRKVGEPFPYRIAGLDINLVPASFVTARHIFKIVHEAKILVKSAPEGKTLEELEGELELMDRYDAIMFRGAQLIIYDAKNKDWVDRYDDFPPQEELDRAVTVKALAKCSTLEVDNLFMIFLQLTKPVLPRKSFLRLGMIL